MRLTKGIAGKIIWILLRKSYLIEKSKTYRLKRKKWHLVTKYFSMKISNTQRI